MLKIFGVLSHEFKYRPPIIFLRDVKRDAELYENPDVTWHRPVSGFWVFELQGCVVHELVSDWVILLKLLEIQVNAEQLIH